MGLLVQALSGLVEQLPATDDSHFARELRSVAALAEGLDPYLEQCAVGESADRRALAEVTAGHDWTVGHDVVGLEREMLSGNVEASTLALLVRATRARRVLEIGTFTGYATMAMAEALPPDGMLVTCERDEQTAELARSGFDRSHVGSQIELRVGPAAQTLAGLAADGAVFDLVFVDADKAGYIGYVDVLLSTGLLADHGLLCVDNTLMQGEPWTDVHTANGAAIARFNDWLSLDPRVAQVIVPLRDGLTLACRSWT